MSCPKTLLKAVTAGRSRQVRLLLELGASTEEQDECGQTPLIRCVLLEHERNREKILRTLLKRGAVVSKADVVGRNALMWACLYGRDSDVALLIEYADVDLDFNHVDINGQTALFHAVSYGNAATVKLIVSALMRYGLSTDTPDNRGTTPLMQAQRLGHDVCESILIYEGNAKVGFQPSEFENFNKREKWAITSLRDRSKVKIGRSRTKQSQFPPIDINVNSNSPKLCVIRQIRGRTKNSEPDYDSSFSEDESFDPINGYSYNKQWTNNHTNENNTVNTPMFDHLQTLPKCNIPSSVLVSVTPSTGNMSSGDESEVDSVASTIIDGKDRSKPVRHPADLNSIYGIKQEQMSSSFRKTAVKVEEPPEEEKCETPISKSKDVATRKWLMLKRGLRLTSIDKARNKTKKGKETNEADSISDREPAINNSALPCIFSDKKSLVMSIVKTESHKIAAKTPRMIMTPRESEKNRSYSEI